MTRVHTGDYFWPPNPYGTETAKNRTAWADRKIKEFHGCSNSFTCYKYDGVRFEPIQEEELPPRRFPFYWRYFYYIRTMPSYRHYFITVRGRLTGAFKYYLYIPQTPRIENGKLMTPLQTTTRIFSSDEYHQFEKNGIWFWQKALRLFPAVDKFPDDIEKGECVYRQIDTQWFIGLCKGR
jgi:hypothetical protein